MPYVETLLALFVIISPHSKVFTESESEREDRKD